MTTKSGQMGSDHQGSDDDIFGDDDDLFRNDTFVDEEAYRPFIPVYVESEPNSEVTKDQLHNSSKSPISPDPEEFKNEVEECLYSSDGEESNEDLPTDIELRSVVNPPTEEHVTKRRLRSHKPYSVVNEDSSLPVKRQSPSDLSNASKYQKSGIDRPLETEETYNVSEPVEETRQMSTSSPAEGTKVRQKIFNLMFLSKLEGTVDRAIELKVLGKYDFASILESVLERVVEEFKIPYPVMHQYTVDNVTLYWNGGKLLKFMTCESLKISNIDTNEVTEIEVTMVSKGDEERFEEEERARLLRVEKEAMLKAKLPTTFEADTSDDNGEADCSIEIIEMDDSSRESEIKEGSKLAPVDLEDIDEPEVIKLALVGQDNARLYVNVRRSTPFSKVIEYYKLHKPLPMEVKLSLYFDHEKLDLNETVGDQELEDEDMLEVVI